MAVWRRDFGHRAHQPGQQIDAVDRLVHQGAAAVQFPGAAPGAAVVVLLGAVPLDVRVADCQSAEAALVDGLLDQLRRFVKPRGKDRGQHDARLVAGVDDLVAAFERDLQRLLDDHVFARPGRRHGRLQMGTAGRADRHHVDLRVGQHRVQIVVGRAAGDFGQPSAAAGTVSKQATTLAPRMSAIALA